MSDSPQQQQQPSYTCDTLPAPQNIQARLPHRYPRSPMSRTPSPNLTLSTHIDASFSTAFDVPTTEEVIAENQHPEPSASSASHKLDSDAFSSQPPARKLCVRHQRMADEGTISKLQQSLDALPVEDREAASSIWSTFSSSSHPRRALILHGLLTMCCFSQLSLISEQLSHLIRIDPFFVLPREINLKILGYLDAISLCRAAQVTKHWRDLADDDVLWRSICEQHIGQKCHKCGWGLPLLEKRRRVPAPLSPPPETRSSKREFIDSQVETERPNKKLKSVEIASHLQSNILAIPLELNQDHTLSAGDLSQDSLVTERHLPHLTRPWKDVYCERLTIERNWRRGRCTVRTLKGHTDGIMCLQYSETLEHPSFPILITGSYDRTARIWNLETGAEVRCLRGHSRAVRALQFDEAKLITGSMDHTIRVWNWRTGRCVRILEGHTEGVVCLNFDSNVLASGSVDTTVKIWNFRTGECFTLRGHRDWVNSVQLWDSNDCYDNCTTPFSENCSASPNTSDGFSSPTIDPGKMLFSASDDGTIRLWDLKKRSCIRQFTGHVGQVQSMKLLLVDPPCDDDIGSDRPSTIEEPSTPPQTSNASLRRSPSTLASGLPGFSPASVSIATIPPPDHPGPDSAAFIPPFGFDPYAYQSNPNAIPIPKSFIHENDAKFRHLSPSVSKRATPVLISGSLDNTIKIWDIETGKAISTLFGHIEGVWAVASDKLRLVSGSHDRTIKVWVREEGRCMATLIGHRGAVTCLALGDDKIVSGSDDGDIRVWSFAS